MGTVMENFGDQLRQERERRNVALDEIARLTKIRVRYLQALEEGQHERYDLRRCFQIGWDAGFRGPWCFEHTHPSLPRLLQDLVQLRDMIRAWTA